MSSSRSASSVATVMREFGSRDATKPKAGESLSGKLIKSCKSLKTAEAC